MDDLLEAINDYYHNHGQYPQVNVSSSFYDEYADYLLAAGIKLGIYFKRDKTVDDWELSPPS